MLSKHNFQFIGLNGRGTSAAQQTGSNGNDIDEDKGHGSRSVHRSELSISIPCEFARKFESKTYGMLESRGFIGERARIKIGGAQRIENIQHDFIAAAVAESQRRQRDAGMDYT